MARLSSATTVIVAFWVSYAVAAALLLYALLPPVSLKLVLILGGAEAAFVVLALAVLHRDRFTHSDDERV